MFLSQHSEAIYLLRDRMMSVGLFYVITQYLVSKKRITFFFVTLIICILWNIGVCAWEVITLQHLPPSRFYNKLSYIPTAAFGNENMIACHFMVSIPILFFSKVKVVSHLCNFVLLLVYLLIIIMGGRINLIIMTPFLIAHFLFKTNILYKIAIVVTIFFLVSHFFSINPTFKRIVTKHFKQNVFSFSSEIKTIRPSSIKERIDIMRIAAGEFGDTKGLGVGIGNYKYSTMFTRKYLGIATQFPHNYIIEVLTDEGIVGVLLFLLIYLSLLKPILQRKLQDSKNYFLNIGAYLQNEKQVLLFSLFFFSTICTTGTLNGRQLYWITLAFNYALIYLS